jgi:hypothetical protein
MLITLGLSIFGAACDKSVGGDENLAPQTNPVVAAIGKDSVTISWNKPESPQLWKYAIGLAEDSTTGNEIKGLNAGKAENVLDTFYTFKGLKPSTWYKAIVNTFPIDSNSNFAPNQSWPPLRFKTLE